MKRFAVIQAVWMSAAGILFFSTLLDASWDLGRLLEGMLVAGFVVSILYLAFIVSNPFFRKLNRVVFSLALIVSVQIMVFIGHYLVPFLSIVDVALDAEAQDVLLRRRLVLGFILSLIWMRSIHIRNRMREREASELQAKVQALQSRIRPHFLFNSMNIIAAFIPVDPDRAERAVEDLSELFRASLQEVGTFVAITQELDLCRRYAYIESLRPGDRLKVFWDIVSGNEEAKIPLLLFQPLIENAIYYGVQPNPEGGKVEFLLNYSGEKVRLKVTNPVPQSLPQQKSKGKGEINSTDACKWKICGAGEPQNAARCDTRGKGKLYDRIGRWAFRCSAAMPAIADSKSFNGSLTNPTGLQLGC